MDPSGPYKGNKFYQTFIYLICDELSEGYLLQLVLYYIYYIPTSTCDQTLNEMKRNYPLIVLAFSYFILFFLFHNTYFII